MAIARRPLGGSLKDPVDVEELIDRGGSPANGNGHGTVQTAKGRKPKTAPPLGVTPVILRVPDATLKRVNDINAMRTVRAPRHTWFLEAIEEKLQREEGLR